jgi:hypothetical protein
MHHRFEGTDPLHSGGSLLWNAGGSAAIERPGKTPGDFFLTGLPQAAMHRIAPSDQLAGKRDCGEEEW